MTFHAPATAPAATDFSNQNKISIFSDKKSQLRLQKSVVVCSQTFPVKTVGLKITRI